MSFNIFSKEQKPTIPELPHSRSLPERTVACTMIVAINLNTGDIRYKDPDSGYLFDVRIRQSEAWQIASALQQPNRWFLRMKEGRGIQVVNEDDKVGYSKDQNEVMAELDFKDAAAIPSTTISGDMLKKGKAPNPDIMVISPRVPLCKRSDLTPDVIKSAAANTPAINFKQDSVSLKGPGPSNVTAGAEGFSVQADTVSMGTWERKQPFTMTQPLDHLFIPLAGAVSLPMPYFPDVVKIAAMGALTKSVIDIIRSTSSAAKLL